jgi:DNA-binding NarL/FixJ family response regulator
LEDLTVAVYDENMVAILITDSTYVLKYFRFREKGDFKLVLDVFSKAEPEEYDEFISFGNFYVTVGNSQKGNAYLKKAEELKRNMPKSLETQITEQVLTVDTLEASEEQIREQKDISEKQTAVKKKVKKDKIILFFVLVVIFNIVVLIVRKLSKRKKNIAKIKESGFRRTEGFGSPEFQKQMVAKLFGEGWEIKEIAQELNLSEERVKKIKKELKK